MLRNEPEVLVRVEFEYRATTTRNPDIITNYRDCASLVGPTHIHTSWNDYDAYPLSVRGDALWVATFDDVPVGVRKIRVSDANACPKNPTGAVTDLVVYANGVLLDTRVDTPGTGTEPGFGFFVNEEGIVSE